MQTAKIEVARKKYPHEARRPFRTIRTGRPGGSGAQPPLHLIHMVKVGRNFPFTVASLSRVISTTRARVSLKETIDLLARRNPLTND